MGADFEKVPIVEVTTENFKEVWPSLKLSIDASLFIAIDCELSGLGDRKKLNEKEIEERYKNICGIAKSRAIISLGISCFQSGVKTSRLSEPVDSNDDIVEKFSVHTYNIIILCRENYVVEPDALKFLVSHGFNFERQYSKGIPYYRGNDRDDESSESVSLRSLMNHIITSKKPIVLHNGIIDLIFIYESFFAELPSRSSSFIADLVMLFPGGVFDTKYISEYVFRYTASYLQYLFRKLQLENLNKYQTAKIYVSINFPIYPPCYYIDSIKCGFSKIDEGDTTVCESFANHGWCKSGTSCKLSHSIDDVLLWENTKQKKGKKRKLNACVTMCAKDKSVSASDGPNVLGRNSGHRAGFDAFMTGFIFLCFLCKKYPSSQTKKLLESNLDFTNMIYLTGKSFPLLVKKSNFGKESKICSAKMMKLFSCHGKETTE